MKLIILMKPIIKHINRRLSKRKSWVFTHPTKKIMCLEIKVLFNIIYHLILVKCYEHSLKRIFTSNCRPVHNNRLAIIIYIDVYCTNQISELSINMCVLWRVINLKKNSKHIYLSLPCTTTDVFVHFGMILYFWC